MKNGKGSSRFRIGEKITLPAVEYSDRTARKWPIQKLIQRETVQKIKSIQATKISKAIAGQEIEFESGEKIVVTERKRITVPSRHKRILSVSGVFTWLKHDSVETFKDAGNSARKEVRDKIGDSWAGQFAFRQERVRGTKTDAGLRPPQIGALHAIGAHWSINSQPATIVMPTGTGKTETMLSAGVAFNQGPILVVVPSIALREQIASKFFSLGLLSKLKCVPDDIQFPVVGTITSRPRNEDDLKIFDECNVVVSTMSSLSSGSATKLHSKIAEKCSVLFVDEAHHIPAATWLTFRDAFKARKVIQFTATPYRRDGKTVDGKCIYSYSLGQAQRDNYFKVINFKSVSELDTTDGDKAIASRAIQQLKDDLKAGCDHLIMARCKSIARAKKIQALYQSLGSKFNPVVLYSGKSNRAGLNAIKDRSSRIVVCVDMLGEGFDLPQLKIAALHDPHKSLAVLLQFTGRFTRVADDTIGDATIIANVANEQFNASLDRLFREDSDWNTLLSGYSSDATEEYRELNEFLEGCERIDEEDADEEISISSHSLIPRFSTVAFKATEFTPQNFHKAIPKGASLARVWLNKKAKVLAYITKELPELNWCKSKTISDREWHLYVAYFDSDKDLLFIHSSNKETLHTELAAEITKGTSKIIAGDNVFRSLGGIKRLMFRNVGLKKPGRRNLRYSMYSGADVANALSPTQTSSTVKSNVFGGGYESGAPTTVGCSIKGRVWSHRAGLIPHFLRWCDKVGAKLCDDSIKTEDIIENVLVPTEVTALPDKVILALELPMELLDRVEDDVHFKNGTQEYSLGEFSVQYDTSDVKTSSVQFSLRHDSFAAHYEIKVGGVSGFKVTWFSGAKLELRLGRRTWKFEDYLNDFPPKVFFVDGSELDGNLMMQPQKASGISFPQENIRTWPWRGIDLKKESMWKDGKRRDDSIQFKAYQETSKEKFDVIFDDDSAGEAADLVCIKNEDKEILVRLIHCKFTTSGEPGARVKDVVEVCSQAVRSRCWHWKFPALCRHLLSRESQRTNRGGVTRFLVGDARRVRELQHLSKQKAVRTEIVIVQPGLTKSNVTSDQAAVLNAAHSYLLETIEVPLQVIGSEVVKRSEVKARSIEAGVIAET